MLSRSTAPLVAIMNTEEPIAALLQAVLEDEGLRVEVLPARDALSEPEAEAFLRRLGPPVVVYRVLAPYAQQWRRFRRIWESDAGQGRRFIIITTDPWTVEERAGLFDPYPVIGEPFDLNDVVLAVHRSFDRMAHQTWVLPGR